MGLAMLTGILPKGRIREKSAKGNVIEKGRHGMEYGTTPFREGHQGTTQKRESNRGGNQTD